MHTLTNRVDLCSPESASLERVRLAMREEGSEADQKFTRISSPSRESRCFSALAERVIEGASEPISRVWLPEGIEDVRNAAKTNEKTKFLDFTITCFSYTIAVCASLLTLFMETTKINSKQGV